VATRKVLSDQIVEENGLITDRGEIRPEVTVEHITKQNKNREN